MVTPDGVLDPPANVLVKEEILEGYSYLKRFEQSTWKYDHEMELTKE